MPYEFLAKNGLISQGNTTVTGSLVATQNITGSNITASGTGSFGIVGIGTTNPIYSLDVSGNARVGDSLYITTATTADAAIEIGRGRSGNGNSYVDLIGDSTYTDYGLRLIRSNGGANTTSAIAHRGTGTLYITAVEAASISLETSNTTRMTITSAGNVGIGTTVPTGSLHVYQAIGVGETAIATIQEGAGGAAELVFRSGNASTNRRGALRFYSNQISTTTAQWTIGASMDQTSGDNSFYFYNASSTSILTLSQTNVGIGVNPVAKLQVAGNISGSSFTSSISNAVGFLGTASWAQTANALNTSNSYTIAGLTNNGTLSQQGTLSMGSGYQILATTGTAPSPGIAFVGDTNTGIYSPSADTIGFSISGSESSRIDSSGNLLISTTTSPSHAGISLGSTGTVRQLLGGMQNTSWRIRERDQIDALAITTNINDSGTQDSAARSSWKLRMGWGNGQDNFLISRSPAASSTFSDLFLVKSDGSVGIGTTNPSTILTISKPIDASAYGSGSRAIDFKLYYPGFDVDSVKASIYVGVSNQGTLQTTKGYLAFLTSATSGSQNLTEKMRIEADGNIGIGTTNPTGNYGKLTVAGGIRTLDDNNSKLELGRYSVGAPNSYIKLGTNSNALHFTNAADNTDLFTILNSGSVGIGTTSPATFLDVVGFNGSYPTSSGTTQATGSIVRLRNRDSNLVLDIGGNGGNGNWLQSTSRVDLSLGYPLLLNPNGGNIGIGTTSPQFLLDVVNTNTTSKLRIGNAGNNFGAQLILAGSNTTKNWVIANQQNLNGTLEFTQTTATGSSTVGTTPAMVINSSGNVGIGTSNPGYNLVVGETGNAGANVPVGATTVLIKAKSSVNNSLLELHDNFDDCQLALFTGPFSSGSAYIGTNNTHSLKFFTYKTDRMTIDWLTGNVGIGTGSPAYLLDVSGSSRHGYRAADTHYFTGSVNISGSLNATASWATNAITASYAVNSGGATLSGGSTNYVPLWTSATALSSSNIYQSGSGNIGIGTTSPSQLLELKKTTGSSIALLNYNDSVKFNINASSAGVGYVGMVSNHDLLFVTNDTERARLTTGGKVGIGTTLPTASLHVKPTSLGADLLILERYATNAKLVYAYEYAADGYIEVRSGADAIISKLSGYASTPSYFQSNVGIGTTTPNNKLHVYNSAGSSTTASNAIAVFEQNSNAGIQVCVPDSSEAGLFFSRNGAAYYSAIARNGTDLTLKNASAVAVTINSSRYVGIGTASPTYILHVNGGATEVGGQSAAGFEKQSSTDGRIAWFSNSTGSGYSSYIYIGSNPGRDWKIGKNVLNSGTIGHFQITNDLNQMRMQINASDDSITFPTGSVGIGTTSPSTKLEVYQTSNDSIIKSKTTTAGAYVYLDSGVDGYFGVNLLNAGTSKWFMGSYNTNDYTITRGLNSTEYFRITTTGNVGIGTSSPSTKLHIYETAAADVIARLTPSNTSYDALLQMTGQGNNMSSEGFEIWYSNTIGDVHLSTTYADDAASIRFHTRTGASKSTSNERLTIAGNGNVGIGTATPGAKLEITGSSNSALLNIKSPISGAILYVSGSGAVGIGTSAVGAYTLQVSGSFGATTKSFIIEHPTKEGKKLVYGSLESPYHGIRLTGRSTLKEGKCKVELPDYIYKLILHDSVNIQLTGIKCNKVLYIDEINVPENYFTIAYDKAVFETYKDYDFFWDFTAIRADVPELETEI